MSENYTTTAINLFVQFITISHRLFVIACSNFDRFSKFLISIHYMHNFARKSCNNIYRQYRLEIEKLVKLLKY